MKLNMLQDQIKVTYSDKIKESGTEYAHRLLLG